jgi:uroporphyrinogen decarboxylase
MERPPIWLMRQAGRYLPEYRELRARSRNFLDFCYTPDLAAEATLQPIRRFGFDAAILFSDILVIPDALGRRVEFVEGEGPRLEPIDSGELMRLNQTNVISHLTPVFETVDRVIQALPENVVLIGFAGAPWTVATYMVEGGSSRDYPNIRSWAYRDPEGFTDLIEILTTATAEYLCAQIDHGAEVVQLFDSWAGVLAADEFTKWSVQPVAEIVRRIKAIHPDVPVIGFPRGAGIGYQVFVRETGIDAVGLDSSIPTDWAAENLQKLVAVQGNLDNLALLAGGPAMDRAIDNILDTLGKGPFIFNLGHGVLPPTPIEHVERLVARVRGSV